MVGVIFTFLPLDWDDMTPDEQDREAREQGFADAADFLAYHWAKEGALRHAEETGIPLI